MPTANHADTSDFDPVLDADPPYTADEIEAKRRELAQEQIDRFPSAVFAKLANVLSDNVSCVDSDRAKLPHGDLSYDELASLAIGGDGDAMFSLVQRAFDDTATGLRDELAYLMPEREVIEALDEDAAYAREMDEVRRASFHY